MKRAATTAVGTLLVLIGSFVLVVGVVLVTVFGLDGRSQSEAMRAVATSSAVVMDPQRADAGLPGSLELSTFTLTATSVDRGETFIGIGPADDVLAYLSGSPYDVARGVDGRSSSLDQVSVEGSGRPLPPGTQSFWTQQTAGAGPQQLVVALGSGEQLLVVMNPDGSGPVDVRIVASVEAAWIGPAGIAATAAGAAIVLIGLWLLLARRSDDEPAATSVPGNANTPTERPEPSEWGPPIAANDVPVPPPPATRVPDQPGAPTSDQVESAPVSVVDLTTTRTIPAQATGTSGRPATVRVGTGSAGPDRPPREPGT
jgi:hypothetical protein